MKLLVVEDEKDLAENLKKGLSEQGYAVDVAYDGEEGGFMAETENYDLIVLDLTLPKKDGIQLCREIRSSNPNTPILMLTARSKVEEKVEGLGAGADDYLTKPFSILELYARVKTLLRRKGNIEAPVLEISDLRIDLFKHEVVRKGVPINLTPKEFALLEVLAKNKGGVVTRSMLLDHVWESDYEGASNIVDVIIANLRKKIDAGDCKKLIYTVYGVGFKLSENP